MYEVAGLAALLASCRGISTPYTRWSPRFQLHSGGSAAKPRWAACNTSVRQYIREAVHHREVGGAFAICNLDSPQCKGVDIPPRLASRAASPLTSYTSERDLWRTDVSAQALHVAARRLCLGWSIGCSES